MRGMTCDIFCNVVDNYGDIGVAWRLSRQLAAEHGLHVRLWLDKLATLNRIWPSAKVDVSRQDLAGVELRHWPNPFPDTTPADLVIEAFGCTLPESYLAAMARREPRPLWLNLEYLSAETWVKGCHGLPSPHPRLPLTAYFFYPGFEPETGGLLREADLLKQCQAYRADSSAQACFWQSLQLPPASPDTLTLSLFAYDNPAIPELLAAWAEGSAGVRCLVPEGVAQSGMEQFLGARLQPGQVVRRGMLEVCGLPFFDQGGYDRLLWSCDLNFARGEDSFVRAQWAALPFVWSIYVQEGDAHWPKLQAFLDLYCQDLAPEAAEAYRRFTSAWNRSQGTAEAWPGLLGHLPELRRHAQRWARRQADMPDLAENLVHFCREKL